MQQNDLISRKALLAEMDKYANPMPNRSGYDFLCGIATAITEIEDAPAVEAEPVKHGRWLLDGRCSNCLANPLTTHKTYCPNCGAKMDGKSNVPRADSEIDFDYEAED